MVRRNTSDLGRSLVFSVLVALAGGLFTLVSLGGVGWFMPTMVYLFLFSLGWNRFLK